MNTYSRQKLPFISVIIPNYNGHLMLKRFLPTYKSLKYPNERREIIIIDDGSVDESVVYIKKNFPEVRLISYQKNRGQPHAMNEGIKAARGEILFIVNNDVRVHEDAFLIASKYFTSHPEVGLLSGKIYNLDPKPGEGKIYNPGFKINRYCAFTGYDRSSFNRIRECDWLPNTALFAKKELFDNAGLFEEKLRFCEDGEFSLKTKLAGYKIIHHPKLIFWHSLGTTLRTPDKRGIDYEKIYENRDYCYFKGKFYIILKFGTPLQILSATLLQFSLMPFYNLVVLRNNTILPMFKAAWDTLFSIKEILDDRRSLRNIVKRKSA